ncbi:sugar ABC transporter permease [Gryllotalpicola koreensis]|uniref:Xylose transport system permease protein XylH n=1 Tax=Gryllotalpicola koreensis TaxID=993086 RepID=A0ABP7ZW23_9MICO
MSNDTNTTTLLPEPTSDLIGSGQEGSLGDQIRGWASRVRQGEMGALPAVAGFIVLSILFSFLSPYFLTERNFANLLTQSAELVMLGMALVFVILLGEIDLSAGVTGGLTMCIWIVLTDATKLNWFLALLIAFVAGLAIGSFIGFFVARVGIPSFVVTLGLFLGFQGLELIIIGAGGNYQVQTPAIVALMNSNLPVWGGWLMLAVFVALSLATAFWDRGRRTAAKVPNGPLSLVFVKSGALLVLGGIAVFLLSQDRSSSIIAIRGVPIVVPIVLAVLWIGTFVLDRTKFGRYIYAVGGNAEAARRSGVNVVLIRFLVFVICSFLAVGSGLFTAGRVGSVDATAGKDIVLSGVAAAVVGGVSLFGGRGRLVHAAVGALVITVITNGLGLLNLPSGLNNVIAGAVLVLAATIDALSRLRSGGSLFRR